MQTPNVSIIIPCYNAENTIKTTIASIKAQTYKSFEVIFINAGSTDNTLSVLENCLTCSDLDYKILTQENKGVSVARNTGIEASCGKYLMFLDADDIYHPSMVGYLVEIIENSKTDTVFCSFTRNIDKLADEKFDNMGKTILFNNYQLQENLLFQYIPCGMTMFIFKKLIIKQFMIGFTPNTKYGEDREFTWKYLCHCNSGIALDMQLYGYFDNPHSATNNVSISKLDLLTAMYRVDEYLQKNNSSFYWVFHKFGCSRIIWTILKTFSKANRRDLFDWCVKPKEAKKHMLQLLLYPDFRIKATSLIYIISPTLFFQCIKKFYRIGG